MYGFAFRFAAAFLAFLIGLLSNQPFSSKARQSIVATPPNNSVAQGTYATSDLTSQGSQADSLARTVAALRQINPLDLDSDVPPAARPLITSLKHQLRDLIADTINGPGNQSPAAESLRIAIWDRLAARGVKVEQPRAGALAEAPNDYSSAFGEIIDVQVQRPTGHDDLITVTTELAIPCGSDASLYVFQRKENKWTLVLAQEANQYENISGAQGMFDYAISPADAKGNFFIVSANVNPWCTSNWQTLRYSVLQISSTAYQPRVLAAGEETIYLGDAPPPYKLEVAKKWFSITFEGDSSDADVANGIIAREHVIKYLIHDYSASRVSH